MKTSRLLNKLDECLSAYSIPMSDPQNDLVLISQILDVHNRELLNLLDESAFRRYLTDDELTRLTTTLNLPELPQDLRLFIGATREQGIEQQLHLRQKYKAIGPKRQIQPIHIPAELPNETDAQAIDINPPTLMAKPVAVLLPSSLAIGIIWQFNKEQGRGWLIPIEQAPDFRKETIEENRKSFQQRSAEPVDYQKWDIVSYRKNQAKAGHVRHQFVGIVAWFNSEFGVLNSRLGEVFVHSRSIGQTTLVEGQLVWFRASYDSSRNRYSARACKPLSSFADLCDLDEQVATLNFLLFEKPDLAALTIQNITVSPEGVDTLIRYRLASILPLITQPEKLKAFVPAWEQITEAIVAAIITTQDISGVQQPVVTLFKTFYQLTPHWMTDDAYVTQLAEASFWNPLQALPDMPNKVHCIDYVLETSRNVQRVWPTGACPAWCLEELQTNLQRWCANLSLSDEAEEQEANKRLRSAATILQMEVAPFEQLIRYNPPYQLTWWLKRPMDFAFPNPNDLEELANLLEQVPKERLSDALNNLPADKLTAVYHYINESNVRTALVANLYERQINEFKVVAFDLETDDQRHVREACVLTLENIYHSRFTTEAQQTELVQTLQQLVSHNPFVIGHNIRAFDMPILTKLGVEFGQVSVWDTLEIEALLSPLLRSFALVTTHDARQDTEKSLALFRNQLHRIVVDWPTYAGVLWAIIPPAVSHWAEEFYTNYGSILPPPNLNTQATFFHQIPVAFPYDFDTLPHDKPTLLVAPRFVWPQFIGLPNVQFWAPISTTDEPNPYTLRFDLHKVETVIRQTRIRQFLLNYLTACQQANISPTVANLPVWTRLQLMAELTDLSAVCSTAPSLPSDPESGPFYLTDEWGLLSLSNADIAPWYIHHLESRLSAVTFKHQVGQLRLHDNTDIFNQPGLWTRMVGGNRFAPVPRQWLDGVPGIVTPPAQLNNFWLEKHSTTEFIVWGNLAQTNLYEQLLTDEDNNGSSPPNEIDTCPLTLVYTKEQAGLFYRLNPETLYRDVYWTGQFYLLQQLTSRQPVVWLIQQDHERSHLQALLESMGYYCPPTERSLVRQLEMLHQSTHRQRVLLATLPMLPLIVQTNYWGPLTFIIDSLPLTEVAMMVPKSAKTQSESNTDEALAADPTDDQDGDTFDETENEVNDSPSTEVEAQNMQRINLAESFELLAPIMQYYRQLLYRNNTDNHLLLTDPRLVDQVGLVKRWSAKKQSIALWERDTEYQTLYDQVTQYIPSPKQVSFNLSDLPRIQQTIERVFLGQNAQGDWLRLRENQQPYFDSIIEPSDDLIVSLPTGGGKSILFQGPALYRGSLSNRLTIVITPLRALMEDQVTKLEELGFFGCVEYINQQSDNIQAIYRRIAGGEITLVYVTPERFRSRSFDRALMMRIQRDGGLEYCVFDEAHCISQWGSEFRPDYLWVATLINRLKKKNGNFPALFFSATISEQIYNDLTEIFQ